MPLTTAGPAPFNDPPCAVNPFVVVNSWSVSKSQMIVPLRESYARRCPSSEPASTTPPTMVGGAICAALQPYSLTHAGLGGAAYQTFFPVASSRANKPPP